MMNRADNVEPWHPWGRVVRVKLGGWLLDCIIEVSGWFVKCAERRGRKTITSYYLRLAFAIKDQVMANAGLARLRGPYLSLPTIGNPTDLVATSSTR